jgi:hypothetical protein
VINKYVIRNFDFGYNDEYSVLDGDLGSIKSVFEDSKSAEDEMKKLTILFLKEEELCNYEPFFEMSNDLFDKLNKFCIEKCGEELDEEFMYSAGLFPEKLIDDDLYQISTITGFKPFRVIQLPEDEKFIALWLNKLEKYAESYSTNFLYYSFVEEFFDKLPYEIDDCFPDFSKETYESLSDTPLLLKKFVLSNPNFIHNEDNNNFTSKSSSFSIYSIPAVDIFTLNSFLKNPMFEIRKLTIDEIKEIEKG